MGSQRSFDHSAAAFRWTFKFTLVTKDRTYELLAASSDERKLWIHDLQRVISKKFEKSRQSSRSKNEIMKLYESLPEHMQVTVQQRKKIALQLMSIAKNATSDQSV